MVLNCAKHHISSLYIYDFANGASNHLSSLPTTCTNTQEVSGNKKQSSELLYKKMSP